MSKTKKAKIKTRVALSVVSGRSKRGVRTKDGLRLRQRPLLDLFAMALAELYPHDKWAPGITIAYLPDEQKFYASVCRYNGPPLAPDKKEVLYSVRGESTLEVVQALAQGWFDKNQAAQQFALKVRRR